MSSLLQWRHSPLGHTSPLRGRSSGGQQKAAKVATTMLDLGGMTPTVLHAFGSWLRKRGRKRRRDLSGPVAGHEISQRSQCGQQRRSQRQLWQQRSRDWHPPLPALSRMGGIRQIRRPTLRIWLRMPEVCSCDQHKSSNIRSSSSCKLGMRPRYGG